jgi:hypothetical protein
MIDGTLNAARAIRAKHFYDFRIARQRAHAALHGAAQAILNGGHGAARILPFETYQRAALQLSLDALTPDDVLLAEARHNADQCRSYRGADDEC